MPPLLRHRNATLSIDNTPLQAGAVAETYLTASASSTTLTVANIVGFAVNQILLIEDLGTENAEIVLTHASSAPSGTTVTLASSLVKTHQPGAKVRVILFNQIELKRGTTTVASSATALTVATTTNANPPSSLGSGLVAVDATRRIQDVGTVEHTSGYYFARYYDSIHTAFGSYTDALVYGGWASNTVGYIIDRALRDSGVEALTDKIRLYDCYEWINDCLKLIQGKLKRWPEHYSYNAILGQIQRGDNTTAMPTDAYDTETNKSIIGLRIGDQKNLQYLSPGDFDNQLTDVRHTAVTTQATSGQTTLAIDNSYDFDDSGYVSVYVSNVKYSIRYTGVTRSSSAGVLTGVPSSGTGSITVTIPVGTDVWQGETEGTPVYFTVRNGNIEHWPLADGSHDNMNLYGDYAKVATSVDTSGDTIDLQRFDMVQAYLTWRMKMKDKTNGTLDIQDGFYLQFKERLNDAIRTLPANNLFRIIPSVNRIGNTRNIPRIADIQDLAIGDQ